MSSLTSASRLNNSITYMLYICTRVVPNYDFNSKPKTVRKRCFMQTQAQRRSLGEIWRRGSKYSGRYMDLKNRRSRSTDWHDFKISSPGTAEPQIWAQLLIEQKCWEIPNCMFESASFLTQNQTVLERVLHCLDTLLANLQSRFLSNFLHCLVSNV